jgi:hypothetical protein
VNSKTVSMRRLVVLGIASLVFFAGCGGSTSNPHAINSPPNPPPSAPSALTASPPTDTLGPAGTRTFAANESVTWTVLEGPAGGTITNTGSYTAPAAPGTYHVVAMATDATETVTATVTVVQSGFTFTGRMMRDRLGHTATLLPTGKVLIVGGGEGPDLIDGFFTIAEAEIFDPLTGTFISAGTTPRDFHTATLLRNGKVLITGGETNGTGSIGDVTNIAELYDPATGLFERTAGSMATARESHTATLLADGRVLVTGGVKPLAGFPFWEALRTAELYDPVVGTFTPTGNMTSPRVFHTATLLPNGMVLITGGADGLSVATAELYNPVTGTFTPTGGMAVSRDNHTATLLSNGRVLVVGGSPAGVTAELYDPFTGLFEPAGRMTTARAWHTATLRPNGTVLIAGGYNGSADTPTAEIYNPSTSSFTPTGSLGDGRLLHTATMLLDGRVFVTGGAASIDGVRITMVPSAEIYK